MPVTAEDLREATSNGLGTDYGNSINHEIVEAIGTRDEYDEKKFARVDPTEEDVCEYWRRFGHKNGKNAPVNSDLHEAVGKWAEKNC